MSKFPGDLHFTDNQTIYYENKWKHFEYQDLRDIFFELTGSFVRALVPGEKVWVNLKNYHPKDGVSGFTHIQIQSIKILREDTFIKFIGTKHQFWWPENNIYVVHNESELLEIVRQHPQCLSLE